MVTNNQYQVLDIAEGMKRLSEQLNSRGTIFMNTQTKNKFVRLYQALILEHHQHPKNCCIIENPCYHLTENKTCGDEVNIYFSLEQKHLNSPSTTISCISFKGEGCAIMIASDLRIGHCDCTLGILAV